MFYENVGKPVRSSGKWLLLFGVAFLLVGMGYGAYLYHKASTPSVPERATRSGPSQQQSMTYGQSVRLLPQDTPGITWAWQTNESQWPRVQAPAHGDSPRIPNLAGNGHIVWGGDGFTIHNVYGDGRECTFIAGTPSSCGGGVVEAYVHNDGITMIQASYAYARQGEK